MTIRLLLNLGQIFCTRGEAETHAAAHTLVLVWAASGGFDSRLAVLRAPRSTLEILG
ncbi:MAG TPA: hypothetical protein VFG22_14725 [Polyangiales bacterium]|nr:hypothetical protein [Polyangiales bacterium]